MTRRMRGFGRTARERLTLLFCGIIGLSCYLWLDPFGQPVEPSLHLSGDGSGQVLDVLKDPDFIQTLESVTWFADHPADAQLEVILLRRPENADGLEHLRRICPGVCERHPVTTFHVLAPFSPRRIVVINLAALERELGSEMDFGAKLDRSEPMTDQQVWCLAIIVSGQIPRIAELRSQTRRFLSFAPTPISSCFDRDDRIVQRVFPFDL